jgi:hypothetical protein
MRRFVLYGLTTNFIHGGAHCATEPTGSTAVTMGWMERGAWLYSSLLDLPRGPDEFQHTFEGMH